MSSKFCFGAVVGAGLDTGAGAGLTTGEEGALLGADTVEPGGVLVRIPEPPAPNSLIKESRSSRPEVGRFVGAVGGNCMDWDCTWLFGTSSGPPLEAILREIRRSLILLITLSSSPPPRAGAMLVPPPTSSCEMEDQ